MKDKVTLVTGATRGIGAAIARTLAEAGAKVIGTATSQAGADKITEALSPFGGRGVVLNVTDIAAIDATAFGAGNQVADQRCFAGAIWAK